MGDYRLSTGVTANRWAIIPAATAVGVPGSTTVLPELDYQSFITYFDKLGRPVYHFPAELDATGSALSGNVGSACYGSAVSLETSNGLEISGLNAEEQSDISFLANWSSAQASGFVLEVYAYYDAMIILRENNVVELIQ